MGKIWEMWFLQPEDVEQADLGLHYLRSLLFPNT